MTANTKERNAPPSTALAMKPAKSQNRSSFDDEEDVDVDAFYSQMGTFSGKSTSAASKSQTSSQAPSASVKSSVSLPKTDTASKIAALPVLRAGVKPGGPPSTLPSLNSSNTPASTSSKLAPLAPLVPPQSSSKQQSKAPSFPTPSQPIEELAYFDEDEEQEAKEALRKQQSVETDSDDQSVSPASEVEGNEYVRSVEHPFKPRREPPEGAPKHAFDLYGPLDTRHADVKNHDTEAREQVNAARHRSCQNREKYLAEWESTLHSRKQDLLKLEGSIDEFEAELDTRTEKCERICNDVEKREKQCTEDLKKLESLLHTCESKQASLRMLNDRLHKLNDDIAAKEAQVTAAEKRLARAKAMESESEARVVDSKATLPVHAATETDPADLMTADAEDLRLKDMRIKELEAELAIARDIEQQLRLKLAEREQQDSLQSSSTAVVDLNDSEASEFVVQGADSEDTSDFAQATESNQGTSFLDSLQCETTDAGSSLSLKAAEKKDSGSFTDSAETHSEGAGYPENVFSRHGEALKKRLGISTSEPDLTYPPSPQPKARRTRMRGLRAAASSAVCSIQ